MFLATSAASGLSPDRAANWLQRSCSACACASFSGRLSGCSSCGFSLGCDFGFFGLEFTNGLRVVGNIALAFRCDTVAGRLGFMGLDGTGLGLMDIMQ